MNLPHQLLSLHLHPLLLVLTSELNFGKCLVHVLAAFGNLILEVVILIVKSHVPFALLSKDIISEILEQLVVLFLQINCKGLSSTL